MDSSTDLFPLVERAKQTSYPYCCCCYHARRKRLPCLGLNTPHRVGPLSAVVVLRGDIVQHEMQPVNDLTPRKSCHRHRQRLHNLHIKTQSNSSSVTASTPASQCVIMQLTVSELARPNALCCRPPNAPSSRMSILMDRLDPALRLLARRISRELRNTARVAPWNMARWVVADVRLRGVGVVFSQAS